MKAQISLPQLSQTLAFPDDHPFVKSPHKSFLSLAFPVMLSLIAEPLTGLVDTAFVSRLGAAPLAALGVGTTTLSSIFWIFNFLGIGTQTEIAQAWGKQAHHRLAELSGLALILSAFIGGLIILAGWPGSESIATAMGAESDIHAGAVVYMQIRFLGTPAVLLTIAAFGILRGLQDMTAPLKIAVFINALNIALDALLIFGAGPFPALGIAGAATASTASQWSGALWAVFIVRSRLGYPTQLRVSDVLKLLKIGGDLFMRTAQLTAFLILTTRAATQIGPEGGAVHQVIRQFWTFTALFLDAYAISGQSLVGFFWGAGRLTLARRVASTVCFWSVVSGIFLTLTMLLGKNLVALLFVPRTAFNCFDTPWMMGALAQPLNALAFATDGIHWGSGDFRYLRNAMFAATAFGVTAVLLLDVNLPGALSWIWIITGGWISIRAALGVLRIWPGIGAAPLREEAG